LWQLFIIFRGLDFLREKAFADFSSLSVCTTAPSSGITTGQKKIILQQIDGEKRDSDFLPVYPDAGFL
jgi:hypothetical protein